MIELNIAIGILLICLVVSTIAMVVAVIHYIKQKPDKSADNSGQPIQPPPPSLPKLDTSMIPENIAIDENLLPYKKDRTHGWGKRFNTYIIPRGQYYHRYRCANIKGKKRTCIHKYTAINNYKPCTKCKPPKNIDSWYKEFLKVNNLDNEQISLFDD